MKRFEGLNSIDKDSYFIRLSDRKDHFIHFEGDNPDDDSEVVYRVIKGEKGACVWHKKECKAFIKNIGKSNVEMVKVTDVLKNDGSLN